nr:MAG TPA: hypothetical protein [Caudoviricetes sp.]
MLGNLRKVIPFEISPHTSRTGGFVLPSYSTQYQPPKSALCLLHLLSQMLLTIPLICGNILHNARATERKQHKTEENTMTEQIKTYFENLRENDANKLSRGTLEAYWTYEFNLNHNSSEFECNELPWTTDMSDFVKTMREAGIETIAVTETSTALLENLHKLASQGCTIEGLCKVSRPDIWGNGKEYPAIRIRIN